MRKLFSIFIFLVWLSAFTSGQTLKCTGGCKVVGGATFGPSPIPGNQQSAITVYIAVNGNDTNSGAADAPVATWPIAISKIRGIPGSKIVAYGVPSHPSGTYFLAAPIDLTVADSGAPGLPMQYTVFPGDTVTISAGKQLSASGWVQIQGLNNIPTYQFLYSSVGVTPFDSIFYNGERRYAPTTTTSTNSYLYTAGSCFPTDVSGSGQCVHPPTGVLGCPVTSYVCYDRFKFSNTDIPSFPHGLGLKDILVENFEKFTESPMRLSSVSNSIATMTGPTQKSANNGFLCAIQDDAQNCTKGYKYLLRNVQENLTEKKQFYNDRCVGCTSGATVPTANWAVTYVANSTPLSNLLDLTSPFSSACYAPGGGPQPACNGTFAGFVDNPAHTGTQTPTLDPAAGHISNISVHTLAYPNWNGKAVWAYQPWWYNVSPFNGHKNISMNENLDSQVADQITKAISFGYDSISVDYYGDVASLAFLKQVTDKIAAYLGAFQPRALSGQLFTLMIMLDKGAINAYCTTNQTVWDGVTTYGLNAGVNVSTQGYISLQASNLNHPPASSPTWWETLDICLTRTLNAQLDIINVTYANQPYYEGTGVRPLVQFFIPENGWSNVGNWSTGSGSIMGQVRAHVDTYAHPFNLLRQYSNPGELGFNGAYAWMKPPTWSSGKQFCWDDQTANTPCNAVTGVGSGGTSYLNGFYTERKARPTEVAMASVYKGFGDYQASWGSDRFFAQQCGQVWLATWAKIAANGYSQSLQIPYILTAAGNDYEEGTEVETGIDNCITIGSPSVAGNLLSWPVVKADATYATTATIHHFDVYRADTFGNLWSVALNLASTSTSLDLTNKVPAGTWFIYVNMVGQPMIINRTSPLVTYVSNSPFQDTNEDPRNPNNEVIRPNLSRIMTLTGTHDILFDGGTVNGQPGLIFAHDNWTPPAAGLGDNSGSPYVTSAVTFLNVSNWEVRNTTFKNISAWAFTVDTNGSSTSANGSLHDSLFYDIGAGAVRLGHWPCTGIAKTLTTCLAADTESNVVQSVTVDNIFVSGIDRKVASAEGKAVWVGNAHHINVTRSEIGDTYGGGVNAGYSLNYEDQFGVLQCSSPNAGPFCLAHDIIFDNLSIYNIGQGIMSDIGCSHWASNNTTGNIIRNIFCHDSIHDTITGAGYGGNGIYFDQATSNVQASNVFVLRASGAGVINNVSDSTHDIYPTNNVVTNSMLVYTGRGIIHRGGENPSAFTLQHSIELWGAGTQQVQPGKWSPFANDCITPVASMTRWMTDHNILYANASISNALDFVTSNPHGQCNVLSAYTYTHYNTTTCGVTPVLTCWKNATGQETGSLNTDPLFVDATYPNDNYNFQSGAAANNAAITFSPFDYTSFGRTNKLMLAPFVPTGFPLQPVSNLTYFGQPNSGVPGLQITTVSPLPDAQVGVSYTQTFSAVGGLTPYTWIFWSGTLPNGLTFTFAGGVAKIAGTPTVAGSFSFALQVTDAQPTSAQKTFAITVTTAPPPPLSVSTPDPMPNGQVNVNYSQTLSATGGLPPYVNWAITGGTLPNGCSLAATTGIISCSPPTTAGTFTFTAEVTDSLSSKATKQLHITINPSATPLTITTTSPLVNGTAGSWFTQSYTATGGVLPYTWTFFSGNLPPGVIFSFSPNVGIVRTEGTPTIAGAYNFSLAVTDGIGTSFHKAFDVTIVNDDSCGPPDYNCARSDLIPAPTPTAPNVGNLTGRGTCFTEPDFSTPVCRVTDSTDATGGMAIGQGGSGDTNMWSLNSTKVTFGNIISGNQCFYTFNTTTMAATKMYGGWCIGDQITWSHLNNDVFYGIADTGSVKGIYRKFDTSSPSIPTPTIAANFIVGSGSLPANGGCLGGGFVPTWITDGGVSADETIFTGGFSNSGGQGGVGAKFVAIITPAGCQVLNTNTGLITSSGTLPNGQIPNWTTLTDADGFTIHNVKMAKNGSYLSVTPTGLTGTQSMMFWQVGTLNVFRATVQASGHFTEGYSHWINAAGQQGNFKSRPYTALDSPTTVIPANLMPNPIPIAVYDLHCGWNNVDSLDTNPFFCSTWTSNVIVPNTPWYNEVIAVSPVTGVTYRFAHTFISATSQRFNDLVAVGAISQDGRFFAWSSDWVGTLGSESGGSTCQLNGRKWVASHAYALNEVVNKDGITPNPASYNFKVTTAGVSGPVVPVWTTAPLVGNTITDGTIVWTNIGVGTCRGEVFVVRLSSGTGGDLIIDPIAGNDANNCQTTLTACQTLTRGTAVAKPGDTVLLRDTGLHFLTAPWTLTSANSGVAGDPITYKNYPGESPVITGGVRLTGWVNSIGNQWTHTGSGLADTEVMYYNGEIRRQPRLGSGTNVVGAQYRVAATDVTCGGLCFDRFFYDPADAPVQAVWANLNNNNAGGGCDAGSNSYPVGNIFIDYFFSFKESRLRVKCTNRTTHEIFFTGNADPNGPFTVGRRFTVENVKDAAGTNTQFFWDKVSNVITYWAGPGENPNTATVMMPQTAPPIVSANAIQYVKFKGLTFSHDNPTIASTGYQGGQSEFSLGASFVCTNCSHDVWDANIFTAGVSHALQITTDATGVCGFNEVKNNLFRNLGAGAILSGRFPPTLADTNANICQFNTIINNRITGVGRVYAFGGAINSGLEQNTKILHNEFDDGYSYGTSTCIPSAANCGTSVSAGPINKEVAYNLGYNFGQGMSMDFGIFYIVNYTALGNSVHDNIGRYASDSSKRDTGFGFSTGPGAEIFYLDNVSQDALFYNNLGHHATNACFRSSRGPQTNGHPNIWDNNIWAYCRTGLFIQGLAPPSTLQQAIIRNSLVFVDRTYLDSPTFIMASGCGPFGTPLTNVQAYGPNDYYNPLADISLNTYASLFPITTSGCVVTGYVNKATWTAAGEDAGSLFNVNPNFVNAAAGDFNLAGPSPLPSFHPFSLTRPGLENPSLVPVNPGAVLPAWPTDTYVDAEY